MAPKLILHYDAVGDILHVTTRAPYAGQDSDGLPDEMVGRYSPKTGELESVEILFFSKRFPRGAIGKGLKLPFRASGPKADPPFRSVRRSTRPAAARSRRG